MLSFDWIAAVGTDLQSEVNESEMLFFLRSQIDNEKIRGGRGAI